MSACLDQRLKDFEIRTTLNSFGPLKASRPDGLHPIFFQKYLHLVGATTTFFCHEVFEKYFMPPP